MNYKNKYLQFVIKFPEASEGKSENKPQGRLLLSHRDDRISIASYPGEFISLQGEEFGIDATLYPEMPGLNGWRFMSNDPIWFPKGATPSVRQRKILMDEVKALVHRHLSRHPEIDIAAGHIKTLRDEEDLINEINSTREKLLQLEEQRVKMFALTIIAKTKLDAMKDHLNAVPMPETPSAPSK